MDQGTKQGISFLTGFLPSLTFCNMLMVFLAVILFLVSCNTSSKEYSAEIVVYGATPGGIPAAVAAAREGHKVILIEPSRTLGGLLGSGFRAIEDMPFKEIVGGLTREYVEKDIALGADPHSWHAKENKRFFEDMIDPYKDNIEIIYEHRIKSAEKVNGEIKSIVLEFAPPMDDGVPAPQAVSEKEITVRGNVFIDASYEGDLMAMAGVSYAVGREGIDEYKESLAGVRGIHRFPGVSPYNVQGDSTSGLLPMIDKTPLGDLGSANPYVNGYNFKFSWLKNATETDSGRIMSTPELSYPEMDTLLNRLKSVGYPITWPHYNDERRELVTGTIPGLQGNYPEGNWETRSRIWRDYIEHYKRLTQVTEGNIIMHTIQNGETQGWPSQLYLRATRRMKGEYVMTQADISLQTEIPDAIGLGFYAIDLHPTRLLVLEDGTLAHEGESTILVSPGPFRLPYKFITPKKEECKNLLVPVCFSASHLAHAAIRLEVQYMILGESAGTAAVQALEENKAVQDIDIQKLQNRLKDNGQIIDWEGEKFGRWRTSVFNNYFPSHILYRWHNHPEDYPNFMPEFRKDVPILIDNQHAELIGDWEPEISKFQPFVSFGYLYSSNKKADKSVVFRPFVPYDGDYEVRISYLSDENRSKKVPVTINYDGGEKKLEINQRKVPEINGLFQSLGVYKFSKGRSGTITVSTKGVDDGDLVVDAIQLVYSGETVSQIKL